MALASLEALGPPGPLQVPSGACDGVAECSAAIEPTAPGPALPSSRPPPFPPTHDLVQTPTVVWTGPVSAHVVRLRRPVRSQGPTVVLLTRTGPAQGAGGWGGGRRPRRTARYGRGRCPPHGGPSRRSGERGAGGGGGGSDLGPGPCRPPVRPQSPCCVMRPDPLMSV